MEMAIVIILSLVAGGGFLGYCSKPYERHQLLNEFLEENWWWLLALALAILSTLS